MSSDVFALVTGGCGYIGSNVVLALRDAGYCPVVIDTLSRGKRANIPDDIPFFRLGVGDVDSVRLILRDYRPTVVHHLAASVSVPESLHKSIEYFRNNVVETLSLLETCILEGVAKFVMASSAAVYGIPATEVVSESSPTRPLNAYGASKLALELLCESVSAAGLIRHVILRNFNVVGAALNGLGGYVSPGSGAVFPVACDVALGRREAFTINGTRLPTPDGTPVRDFVHVTDVARAHVLAARYLERGGESVVLNCGVGKGYSVREIIAAFAHKTGGAIKTLEGPPLSADIPAIVARTERIRVILGWNPVHDLDEMVGSSLERQR